jgi:hypothetical protein
MISKKVFLIILIILIILFGIFIGINFAEDAGSVQEECKKIGARWYLENQCLKTYEDGTAEFINFVYDNGKYYRLNKKKEMKE